MTVIGAQSRRLLAVLAGAFLLRALVAIALQWTLDHRLHREYLIPGDAEGYWGLAKAIVRGDDYAIYTPPRAILRMPGFPGVLAASIALFGDNLLAARLVLALVGAANCAFVYWLGRLLFDAPTGLCAAALTAVVPTFVGFSPLILSESTFAGAMTASLAAVAWVHRRVSGPSCCPFRGAIVPSLTAGGLMGVACYVRPSWLLAAPLLGLLLIAALPGKRRLGLLAAGGLMAGMLLVLSPWAIRNYGLTGRIVLTTLWLGPSLYDGLHPGATGDSDMAFFDQENLLQRLSEYEVDREYRRRAWEFAREQPGRALELALIKQRRYWAPWPNAEQFSSVPFRLAVLASSAPLWLLALMTVVRLRPGLLACCLVLGPLLYFAALHAVFVGSIRYRIPAELPLVVFAAAALMHFGKPPATVFGAASVPADGGARGALREGPPS